jgi:CBS domain-containing protein
MPALRVRDVMLPLDDVPTIEESATLREAVLAVKLAQERRPEGRLAYRAVLVVNSQGRIVGKIGHLSFLGALEPSREPQRALDRMGIPPELIETVSGHMRVLGGDLETLCQRAARLKARDVMRTLDESIDADALLPEAISTIVSLQALSILVRDEGQIVGLLRLADLYDVIARMIDGGNGTHTLEGN